MSFNLGSPGPERKISILGYDENTETPFFAKFSQKPDARTRSVNEISVLQKLRDTTLVPLLYFHEINDEYVFLKTELIEGRRPNDLSVSTELLNLLFSVGELPIAVPDNGRELRYRFSHGDFCPWNMLVTENGLRLIDWEMAADRPLGYDLFTYIFQTIFLLKPSVSPKKLLTKNRDWIVNYFTHYDVAEWEPYLKDFINKKIVQIYQWKKQTLLQPFLRLRAIIQD